MLPELFDRLFEGTQLVSLFEATDLWWRVRWREEDLAENPSAKNVATPPGTYFMAV